MAYFKMVKSFIRKAVFHPFGYDIVPLNKAVIQARPAPRKPPPKSGGVAYKLALYTELFGEEAVSQRRFYNVGASNQFYHPAWTTVDQPSDHYGHDAMDISWDLLSSDPLPIESDKACVIYSRYTLEHVTDEAVERFLRESYRALRSGGFLRVIVPNIDLFFWAYQNKDPSLFDRGQKPDTEFPNAKFLQNPDKASFEQRFLWVFASNASTLHADGAKQRISDAELRKLFAEMSYTDALDFCIGKCSLEAQRRYPEDHINWFNADKLLGMVNGAGFTKVFRSGYGQSRCPVLRDISLFDARAPEIGLYVEAIK